ncbi:site-specific tyrosine recombinase XerC [Flavonifractor plautii]|nr:site-specific tyrosine recombinase XerC [Flavonifractor plautii]
MAKRRPSGDGMVRKKEDGRWEGRIVVGHKQSGEPIFRYVYGRTQKELLSKLHQSIETYQDVELTEDSRITLGEWLDRWLDEYKTGTIRPSTMYGYRQYARLYIKPILGDKVISRITSTDIQRMYTKLKREGRIHEHPEYGYQLSDAMLSRIHAMLHHAMKDAVGAHLIAKNPTEGTVVPKPNYRPKQILNEEQLDTFMAAIEQDEVWRDFFFTELTTGLRRGEICGLRWEDFDEAEGTLKVNRSVSTRKAGSLEVGETKTNKGRRTISLPDSTAQRLRERKKTAISDWIFPNPLHPEEPVNPGYAYNRMKTVLKNTGLPSIRFHDLRHPYVKHTTKIFSLRLMDFQAQAYPDARRKTRGACQLLRVGQSRSPVRPLCNRKRFSCLPPQSKMSWILYAISMRLSGYTSTRSISSSASSVVSVSASKIALDASMRLSCRACSSCFCFACANTAA